MNILAGLVGLEAVLAAVAINLANVILLGYFLPLYLTRQGQQRHIRPGAVRNRLGAATTLIVLMLVWGGFSILWCPSPVPATFYYLAYLVQVFVVYILLKLYPIHAVLRCAFRGTAYAAAVTIPLIIPLTGYSGGRLGETDQTTIVSTIAFAACLGILSVMYLVQDRAISKTLATIMMIILLAGLLLTFAKTEIIALALTGLVYVLLAPGAWRQRTARTAWMATGAAISWIIVSSKAADYMSKARGFITLTGRTVMWAQAIAQIMNGPTIRGFGFMAFREIGPISRGALGHVPHAHNEFVTLWFNFGIVGVVLVFASYFALGLASVRAIRRRGGIKAVLVLCALIFCLIRGVTEANTFMCVLPIPWLLLFDCMVSTYLAEIARDAALARSFGRIRVQQSIL